LEDSAGISPPLLELASVGRSRFGEDTAALQAWLLPLQRQLQQESAVKVIRQLEALQGGLEAGSPAREMVAREVACLREPQS
jgi:hypothetical protein